MVKNNLKDSDENHFTLENPTLKLIQVIIALWLDRVFKNNRCSLRLSI